MKPNPKAKEELSLVGANYQCPRCSGRGWLYLADPDVKEKKPKK